MHAAPRSSPLPILLGLAAALVYFAVVCSALLSRGEYYDTIAYGLPGANFVTRGVLAVPQLGDQYALDRVWLLNAPLLVAGPIPFFAVLGVGRMPYLFGMLLIAAVNLAVVSAALKRGLQLRHAGVAVALSLAFLLHRGLPLADLYNHRYTVLVFSLVPLAFWPTPAGTRWWQGGAAGALVLAHPATALLGVGWVAGMLWHMRGLPPGAGRQALGALVAFTAAIALAVWWYARPSALEAQFFPHLEYGNFRALDAFSGLTAATAGPLLAAPSRVFNGLLAGLTVRLLLTPRRHDRSPLSPARVAAACTLVLLAADLSRGFLYLGYALIGAAPLMTHAVPDRWRRAAVVLLGAFALANVAVAARLDRSPVATTTTGDTLEFLRRHVREEDRVVLGPPFVYAAALGDPQQYPRVVPQPYFLAGWDAKAFRADVNRLCNVYIGAPEWYHRLNWVEPSTPIPLLDAASIEERVFEGQRIIIARRTARAP